MYWIIPLILFCLCSYNYINAIWILRAVTDSMERLDGDAYLLTAVIQTVFWLISVVIAIALTVYSYRKSHDQDMY